MTGYSDPFFWIISSYYGYYNANGNIVSPPCKFLTAISPSASATYAPSVTWITPSSADSDHAAVTQNRYGPDWVTAVVDAIGQSRYWKNSVIFITWDDWGGWYDHVQPLYEDYDGTGIRVPFIIISPYTKAGVVTHTQYEQASILRYIEDLYGLKTMAASDARAADPADDGKIWNLSATPRPFATISPYPQGYNCNAEGSPDDG